MRCLAVITLLILALTLVQPVAAQSFKPDRKAGWDAYHKRDDATALKHWSTLATQGDVRARSHLAFMYSQGNGVVQDFAKAAFWYRKVAEQGYRDEQFRLGSMYYSGRGVPKAYHQALDWYRKAGNSGQPQAQQHLGRMYREGHGVLQDLVMAYVWFSVAVTNGFSFAKKGRDKVLPRLNASERRLALKLSKLCLKKPAKCPGV
jgi:TPR repeat protein